MSSSTVVEYDDWVVGSDVIMLDSKVEMGAANGDVDAEDIEWGSIVRDWSTGEHIWEARTGLSIDDVGLIWHDTAINITNITMKLHTN